MNIKKILAVTLLILVCTSLCAGTFPQVKAKAADGNSFLFPDDALQKGPALFAFAISTSRENGEEQQKSLIEWQTFFNENPSVLAGLPVYHFPVIGSVPFFVKGAIRNGIWKIYSPQVESEQVAVLFISDLEGFSETSGIPIDTLATLALVDQTGTVLNYLKGGVNEENLDRLQEIVSRDK
jgi:hypothetical protein